MEACARQEGAAGGDPDGACADAPFLYLADGGLAKAPLAPCLAAVAEKVSAHPSPPPQPPQALSVILANGTLLPVPSSRQCAGVTCTSVSSPN